MKNIKFTQHVLPHLVAVVVFLIVTVVLFNPVFFENKAINQHDINQHIGSAKVLRDYRAATGEEGLWASSMFSGMPAYLVNIEWSNGVVAWSKQILSLFLPHPVSTIFLAFLSYYIMLLTFRIRPWLAIAGALAFGLSSYLIIGLSAGHNARIGAIAFMPLVIAGIHLAFSGKRLLGLGVTALGLSLHLRENHLQITYYMLLIVLIYGLVQLVTAIRAGQVSEFFKSIGVLIPAVLIAMGTFLGPFWAITEYSHYSIRGPSELVKKDVQAPQGLSKDYAFAYRIGLAEPITLLIPNFYGGNGSTFFVSDQSSSTYKALVASSDQQQANQLAQYSNGFWGLQDPSPYYGGAIICFLFVLGILFAEKKYVWWLVPVFALSILLTWGDSFKSFNYFMFDYFPGYGMFRSVTFAIIIAIFALPLLGFLGLEKFLETGLNKQTKKKLLIAFAATGGLCLLFILFAGFLNVLREGESKLPVWFTNALQDDRHGVIRIDALRSLIFISVVFLLLYFDGLKRISALGFFTIIILLVAVDAGVVDTRYFTKDNYQRKRPTATFFEPSVADQTILRDKDNYRVFNLIDPWNEARTSYFHRSLGGYHGAKLRRYQDLYDSAIISDTRKLVADLQSGKPNFRNYGVLNMLNTRYVVFGPEANNVLGNPYANGNAWFVHAVFPVNSATEELGKIRQLNAHDLAVVDVTKFKVGSYSYDSLSKIKLTEATPASMKYESESSVNGFAVFSEIYYPKGWTATIDGKETPIIRADYVLRALEIPAGKHVIEFKFAPRPYVIGNKVTLASSWILLLVVLGSIGLTLKKSE